MPPAGHDQLTSICNCARGTEKGDAALNTSPPLSGRVAQGSRKAVREDRPGGNLHPKFGLSVEHRVGIIIQNSSVIHHKLPVNLVVWSCGYVRALRAAGSGFDPRFRHSLRSSG